MPCAGQMWQDCTLGTSWCVYPWAWWLEKAGTSPSSTACPCVSLALYQRVAEGRCWGLATAMPGPKQPQKSLDRCFSSESSPGHHSV